MPRLGRATRIAPVLLRGTSIEEVLFSAPFVPTFTVHQPVRVTSNNVLVPLLARSIIVYEPGIHQTLDGPVWASTLAVYEPTVDNPDAAQSVTQDDAFVPTLTVHAPHMMVYVSMPTVSLQPSIKDPVIPPPAIPDVIVAQIGSTFTVYAPILGEPVEAPLVTNPITVFEPTITSDMVTPPLLTMGGITVYKPIGILPQTIGTIFLRGHYTQVIKLSADHNPVLRKSGRYERTLHKKGEYDT